MPVRTLISIILLKMIFLTACGGSAPANTASYYVALNGSDSNPGSIDKPFATLAHARDVARNMQDAIVYLRRGTYYQTETLQFDQRDSGTTWTAYGDESVAISGGVLIVGWNGPDSQGRWMAHSDIDNFRQLYVNGIRATRSRLPLTKPTLVVSSDTIDGAAGFFITGSAASTWKNPTDAELGLFGSYNAWTQSICGVQSTTAVSGATMVTLQDPCFYLARHKTGIQVDTAAYLENIFELLDAGQFYFDRPNHTVYYIPRPGEDMRTAVIVAPLLQTLMTLTGTIDQPAFNLHFENITFEHTGWLGASSPEGFPEVQAAFRLDPNTMITLPNGWLSDLNAEFEKTPGGVILSYVDNTIFERCSFSHMGGSGIDIQSGSRGNVILGAKVYDISANGIQIGDVQADDFSPPDPRMIVDGNTVSNSYIHDTGAEFTGSVGIFAGYVSHARLVHNEITKLPYTGISIGWGWGQEDPTPARENLVQYNHIHQIMQQRCDGGGIYTLGSMPGTLLDSNLIDDNPGAPGGIYLDEGSDGITVSNNVVFGEGFCAQFTTSSAIHFNDSCKSLGCPIRDNILDNPSATLPQAGLEPAYQDLLN